MLVSLGVHRKYYLPTYLVYFESRNLFWYSMKFYRYFCSFWTFYYVYGVVTKNTLQTKSTQNYQKSKRYMKIDILTKFEVFWSIW